MSRCTTTSRPRSTLVALVATAALALSGCGNDDPGASEPMPADDSPGADTTPTASKPPSPSESQSKEPEPDPEPTTVAVTIKGGSVEPMAETIDLEVGETLKLDITSDRAGELHVHSNPEQEPAFTAGSSTVRLSFDKPGQVDVEEHDSGVLILRVLVR